VNANSKKVEVGKVKKSRVLLVLAAGLLLLMASVVSAKTITIEYVTLGGVQMDIMDEMVAQFEKENPDIKVNVQDWPFADAYTKYVTSIRAGNPPDVGYMFVTNLEEFKERGGIVPLDDYLSPEMKADFYPVLLDRNTLSDGHIWALPAWFSTRLFMYRNDLLEEHGLSVPQTPEELLNIVQTLHNPPEMYGFAFPGKSTRHIFRWFGTQLWGRGGDFFNEDMSEATFNGAAGVEALTFLNELKPYFQPGYLQEDEHDVERLFYLGRIPVVQMYYRVLTNAMEQNPDWDVVADYIPTPEKVTLGIMDSYSIFKTTPERQEASWKWLQFILREEYRVHSNLQLGFQPVRDSVAQAFMADEVVQKYPAIEQFIDSTAYAYFEPIHPMWSQIEDSIGRAIQECFLDRLTPQEALDKAAVETNAILAEYAK